MYCTPRAPDDRTAWRRDAPSPTPPTTRAHDVVADGIADGRRLSVDAVGDPAVPSECQTAARLAAADGHPKYMVPDDGRPGHVATLYIYIYIYVYCSTYWLSNVMMCKLPDDTQILPGTLSPTYTYDILYY